MDEFACPSLMTACLATSTFTCNIANTRLWSPAAATCATVPPSLSPRAPGTRCSADRILDDWSCQLWPARRAWPWACALIKDRAWLRHLSHQADSFVRCTARTRTAAVATRVYARGCPILQSAYACGVERLLASYRSIPAIVSIRLAKPTQICVPAPASNTMHAA